MFLDVCVSMIIDLVCWVWLKLLWVCVCVWRTCLYECVSVLSCGIRSCFLPNIIPIFFAFLYP